MAPQADPTTEAFPGTERFRIVRGLGAGGMGVVYEAWDAERGVAVALKTLRSMSAERLRMFKNEFRTLQDLAHPNLATLHELYEHAGQWFFTMELVLGVPLLEYLRGPEDRQVTETRTQTRPSADTGAGARLVEAWGPIEERPMPAVDVARLGPVLAQLARGLAALHRRGKVHRDIKPSNILVTGPGRVVILDFGLVVTAGESIAPSSALGTPGYMAPEQAGGSWVGPPADWYAVGVILYQAMCGRLPFLGSAADVLRAKQQVTPIPPRVINPDAPEWLEALCLALMRAAPDRRAGAAEVLAALGERSLGDGDGGGELDDLAPSGPGFLGRAAELEILDRALADATGGPITVLVRGESGIGKSALVAEWASRLAERDPDVLVLHGRCYEREALPYKAMDGVIDALARHLRDQPAAEVAALFPPHRAVLARVFPALGAVREAPAAASRAPAAVSPSPNGADGPEVEGSEPAQVRRQLYAAMRGLVCDVAWQRRLVIAIDDLQWADADGLALLAETLAPPAAPPVLVVVTERREEGDLDSAGHAMLTEAGVTGEVRRLELGGLLPADAAALATRHHGGRDAAAIAAEADGHPLFIAELARAGARPRAPTASTEPRASRLEEALWRRIAAHPELHRALLEVVAVAGRPLRQDLAAACAGVLPAQLVGVLVGLRDATLIRTSGPLLADAVDAYHGRVRDAVLAHLPASARRARHLRLAAVLEAAPDRDAEAVADHWLEGGDPARALGFLIEAAAQAARALAFDRAVRLYRKAEELAADDPARAHAIRIGLGRSLADGGRGAEAARVMRRAAADSDPGTALALRRGAAEQLLRAGHVDEGLDGLREALAAVDLELPQDARAALPRLIVLRARLRLRGLRLARPRPMAPALAAQLDACWSAAVGLAMVDGVRGAEFQTRLLLAALNAGDTYRAALAMSLEVGHLAVAGCSAAGRVARVIEQARALAAATGDPHAMAMATAAAGLAAYLMGGFADALELSSQATRRFRAQCVGAIWERDTVVIVGGWARVYMGQFKELARRVPELLAEAEDLGDRYLETSLQTGTMVMVPLARGLAAEARRTATEVMRRWSHRGFLHQHWDDLLGQGEIDLYEGDARGAHRRVVERWAALKRAMVLMIQMSRCEAWSLRARAALTARVTATGSDARALEAEVTAGLGALRGEAPWTEPVGAMLAAGLAHVRGQRERAAAHLRAAVTGFDAVHMALHASVARRRLATLIGGSEGDELAAHARAYHLREGVVAPDRLDALLAPGFPR